MDEIFKEPRFTPFSLEDIGYSIEDSVVLSDVLTARELYKNEVAPRVQRAETLKTTADLLAQLRIQCMPSTPSTGNELPEDEKERIVVLAEQIGTERGHAEKLLFSDDGLLNKARSAWQNTNIFSEKQRRLTVGRMITESLSELAEKNRDLNSLLSEEKTIPIQTVEGEKKVSPRDILALNLDSFALRMAQLELIGAEAMKADPDIATYAAYEWTKQTAKEAANENSDIFSTPDTEAVKEQIRIASSKRNGLLKYILFGEAGVGKTRLIQAVNQEQGKETVVINFHQFITFEELIGQTAMTVDLEGSKGENTFEKVAERFGEMTDSEQFWNDMTNVFEHLPHSLQKQYKTVEEFVGKYGQVDPHEPEMEKTRDEIKESFQKRIKAIRDISVLGLSESTQNLQAKWIQGAILNAMQSGKVVCFDEMDKAGPYAIEGLLSFLSLEPGKMWNYQGGSVKIPDDFYISATSNRSNIGALANSDEMNRYLADRTEQILVKPQSVKGSLMIAAASLSDTKGNLLLNKEEQTQLISVFSYILPKLQDAELSMPVTNRIIKTICSRLVNYHESSDGTRHYARVYNRNGVPQTVGEALRLSVLEMKGMSLGEEGKETVGEILSQYSSLLGEEKIQRFGSEFDIDDLFFGGDKTQSRKHDLERRKKLVESAWEQPLFQAIAALDARTPPVQSVHVEEVDLNLLNLPSTSELLAKRGTLDQKILGRRNGVVLNPTINGIFLQTHLPDSLAVLDEIKITDGKYENAVIKSADQLGNAFAVTRPNNQVDIFIDGMQDVSFSPDIDMPVIIDPQGRYTVYKKNNRVLMHNLLDKTTDIPLTISGKKGRVVDLSPNGNYILLSADSSYGIYLIGDEESSVSPRLIPLQQNQSSERAFFLSNNLLILPQEDKPKALIIQ